MIKLEKQVFDRILSGKDYQEKNRFKSEKIEISVVGNEKIYSIKENDILDNKLNFKEKLKQFSLEKKLEKGLRKA